MSFVNSPCFPFTSQHGNVDHISNSSYRHTYTYIYKEYSFLLSCSSHLLERNFFTYSGGNVLIPNQFGTGSYLGLGCMFHLHFYDC